MQAEVAGAGNASIDANGGMGAGVAIFIVLLVLLSAAGCCWVFVVAKRQDDESSDDDEGEEKAPVVETAVGEGEKQQEVQVPAVA
eukprot:COSAG02_NODE_401_length_23083_cov_26.955839_1_plen_85_part_00